MIALRSQNLINRQLPLMFGLVLFGCIGFLTERMHSTQRQSAQMAVNIDLRNDLYTVREKIDQSLSALIYRTLGLTAYIQAKHGKVVPQEIDLMLAALYSSSDHVRNFGVAQGTTLTYVYPYRGNESVIGVDYRDVSGQWPDVLAAMNSTEGVLAGPTELIQGGAALIFRTPIRVDGQYWGLHSTVIDVSSFLQDIASSRMFAGGNLSIRTVSGSSDGLLYGDGSAFETPNAQRVDVKVPGGYWELAIASSQRISDPLLGTWRVIGWLLAALLGIGVATILIQRRALQRLALVDELTGVANRRQFDLMLERSCEKYNRRNSGCFAVLYIDLDNFKDINDDHGHRAGDFFLVELAKRARQAIRGGDLLARWGGDEFAIILDNPTQSNVSHVVDRVRTLCEQPVQWKSASIKVGASIGVVHYPKDGVTPDALLSAADQKMYANKRFRQQSTEGAKQI